MNDIAQSVLSALDSASAVPFIENMHFTSTADIFNTTIPAWQTASTSYQWGDFVEKSAAACPVIPERAPTMRELWQD